MEMDNSVPLTENIALCALRLNLSGRYRKTVTIVLSK